MVATAALDSACLSAIGAPQVLADKAHSTRWQDWPAEWRNHDALPALVAAMTQPNHESYKVAAGRSDEENREGSPLWRLRRCVLRGIGCCHSRSDGVRQEAFAPRLRARVHALLLAPCGTLARCLVSL